MLKYLEIHNEPGPMCDFPESKDIKDYCWCKIDPKIHRCPQLKFQMSFQR